RSARTREAIVTALLELVEEEGVAPTGAAIAARAGVALRSIGQHFKSREELLLAAASTHTARVKGGASPLDAAAPLAKRAKEFCAARARELDATSAVRRASARFEVSSRAVADAFRAVARARRAAVARVFEPELGSLARSERTEVL